MDDISEKALQALRAENPQAALVELKELLREAPHRVDLRHAIATVLLRMGESRAAQQIAQEGLQMAKSQDGPPMETLIAPFQILIANALEDQSRPEEAAVIYQQLLNSECDEAYVRLRYAYLLLGWGRTKDGLQEMQRYLDNGTDDPEALEAHEQLLKDIRKFQDADVHPKVFIEAHRGCYVSEFDQLFERIEKDGWMAEAARMKKDEEGNLVPSIPEGARPYAAIRVDLINPTTLQPGRIGDSPLIVAIEGHETLAQLPLVDQWPDQPFSTYVSSQTPWNNLAIQIRFVGDSGSVADEAIGAWYEAGFNGAFGAADRGMLHEITDPIYPNIQSVIYYVDLGRAEFTAITDLLQRLSVLHGSHPIASVLLGNGYLPAD